MCDQKTFPRNWSVRSLHVETVLDGTTGDFLAMLSDESNGGQDGCSLIEAEVLMSEEADEVIIGCTASAEL